MAWTDTDGTVHPSADDIVTAEGLEHMDVCDVCSGRQNHRRASTARTITTVAELDALPVYSVVMGFAENADQLVSRKSFDGCWEQAGTDDAWQADGIIKNYGSVTVLYEGAEDE